MTVAITPTEGKSCGYLTLDQKLGKNLKGKQRHYLHVWQEPEKHPMSKQTEATT